MYLCVGRHACCMCVCIYVCTDIQMYAGRHAGICSYIHMCDMHKSIHVSMCACITYVCMHVHMHGGKNPYVCM